MNRNKKVNLIIKARRLYSKNRMLISGIILCLVGVIACIVFPEDAMGGVFCVILGIPVTISGIANNYFFYGQTDGYVRMDHRRKAQKSA